MTPAATTAMGSNRATFPETPGTLSPHALPT